MTNEADQDGRLRAILARHNASACTNCGRIIDRGDIAWNASSTMAGTPTSFVEIQCQACDTEIAQVFSWWPSVQSFREAVNILAQDWH